MSYILDALKKSERERTLGAVPSLSSSRVGRNKVIPKGWLLAFLLAALALVVVFVVMMWLPVSEIEPISGAGELKKNQTDSSVETTQIPNGGNESVQPGLQRQQSAPLSAKDAGPAIQDKVSKLAINALSYSDDRSKRFVMINQDILREGDELDNGASIAEIRKSAVVLQFDDIQIIMQP